MKAILSLVLIIFFAFPNTANCQYWDKVKSIYQDTKESIIKPKPAEIDIKEIVDTTKNITGKLKSTSAGYVSATIKKHSRIIAELNTKIDKNFWNRPTVEEEFEAIYDAISTLTDFYSDLDAQKNDVAKNLKESCKNIESMLKLQKKAIRDEYDYIDFLEREKLRNLNKSAKEIDITNKALGNRINFAKQRISMFEKVETHYPKIISIVNEADKKISLFIVLVENNAQVYKEALSTLKVRKDIKEYFDSLQMLDNMDALAIELTDSWDDLENILQNLSEIVINI